MKTFTTTLFADSGSTKTDWALGSLRVKTQGINPFHQDDSTISAVLTGELLPRLQGAKVESVRFYGSGVRPELEEKMNRLLRHCFPEAKVVEAHSDLLGAAIALCGHQEGIACILGTGANSCLFDGEKIVGNTPPLGYILGDEGSGAVLGARFLNALYKNRLPLDVKERFEADVKVTMSEVINLVYRQPMANRWLASLSPFILKETAVPEVEALVVDNFVDFIQRNIAPYGRKDLPVSAVGSVAFYYEKQFRMALQREGYQLGRIVKSPIDGLVQVEQFG